MRSAVERDTPKSTRIPVEDRQGVRTLHDLELIRHTESLRAGQRHAIGGSARIVRTAHRSEFLGSGFEDRSIRGASGISAAATTRRSVSTTSTGSISTTSGISTATAAITERENTFFI